MRLKEILNRLTGLNIGVVGAQWNPPEPHCVESVIEIRRLLTNELGALEKNVPLASSLSAMLEGGYEGYVAKDEESAYIGGRTRSWLKVKQPGWTDVEDRWRPRSFAENSR